jgi:hypothetical protein
MKRQISTIMPVVAISGILVAFAAGCPSHHHRHGVSGYCDDSGCYECDLDKHCWPIPNAKCTGPDSCAGGTVCTSIGCAKACSLVTDCAEGEACVTGFCAPGGFSKVSPYLPPTTCSGDSGCKSDEVCDAGSCIPRCKSDDDCGPDAVCAECGKCQPKGIPATCGAAQLFCSEQVGCGTGKSCVKNRCHAQCTSSATCAVGQLCKDGLCIDDESPAQPACMLDLQCSDGVCINGYCHDRCKTSAECGAGALCQMGVCQPDYNPAK